MKLIDWFNSAHRGKLLQRMVARDRAKGFSIAHVTSRVGRGAGNVNL